MSWEDIPLTLQAIPQWVLWRDNKVPCNMHGVPVDASAPTSWMPFQAACASGFAIGFCPRDVHIGGLKLSLVDIDVDDMSWAPSGWYVERSPSKLGYRAAVLIDPALVPAERKYVQLHHPGGGAHIGELFVNGGYCTFTGDVVQAGEVHPWPDASQWIRRGEATGLPFNGPLDTAPFDPRHLSKHLLEVYTGTGEHDRSQYMLPLLAVLSWQCEALEELISRAWHTDTLHAYFVDHRRTERRARAFCQEECTRAWAMRDENMPTNVALLRVEPPAEPSLFTLQWVMDRAISEPTWWIENVIPLPRGKGATGLLYGDPSTGKSLCEQTMVLSCALGRPWMGRPMHRTGLAVYLTSEDVDGAQWRIQQWARALGEGVVPVLINLGDVRLTPRRLEELRAEIDAYCEVTRLPLVLLVIDTMRGHFDGRSENSGDDTEEFLSRIRASITIPHDAVLLLTHHTNKVGDIRGSSNILAFFDCVWEVAAPSGGFVELRCIKMRNFDRSRLTPISLELSSGLFGEPVLREATIQEQLLDPVAILERMLRGE